MRDRPLSRRAFLGTAAGLAAWPYLPPTPSPTPRPHPRLFLSATPHPGLRTVDDLRASVRAGLSAGMWARILATGRAEWAMPPLTPASHVPGRAPVMAEQRNPDFTICQAAGQRLLRAALVALVTGDTTARADAIHQAATLFDPAYWPEWRDQAHVRFGHPADLRTGMLGHDVAIAYDWLYPSLSPAERTLFEEGLNRCAVQPFLVSLDQQPFWIEEMNNWSTTICCGMGVAGMALGDANPHAGRLIDVGRRILARYEAIYGPEGEFNESPAYGNANIRPIDFYMAEHSWSGEADPRLSAGLYPSTCYWTLYMTLPPGRVAAFGDAHVEAAPWVQHVAAVARASRDPILQWYYRQIAGASDDPLALLWYDDALPAESPDGRLPKGRAFAAHGGCISSRTDWDLRHTACVVYGKSGREANHEHNDVGQVCIDGYGERLIVDLGSPSGYPADFFEADARWAYYNASALGHNVLMVEGREPRTDAGASGTLRETLFDDTRGGCWQIDLTACYDGVERVRRTVVHLLPGVVAVLDEADLSAPQPLSLRWHTAGVSMPDDDGAFVAAGQRAAVVGRIVRPDGGPIALTQRRHAYTPPYDRDRTGTLLEQRRESYIEATATDRRCRMLTLFSVYPTPTPAPRWRHDADGWTVSTPAGDVRARIDASTLSVTYAATGDGWRINTE